jgi:hypothetical protein
MSNQDSPLSIAASVTGILTFAYALVAGAVAYLLAIRSFQHSHHDIQRFYEAFTACALESDLVRRDILTTHSAMFKSSSADTLGVDNPISNDNYLMDPDSLSRLFEQVRALEIELQRRAAKVIELRPAGEASLAERLFRRGQWVNQSKQLEASLAKREALTSRLLVIQMSLFSA